MRVKIANQKRFFKSTVLCLLVIQIIIGTLFGATKVIGKETVTYTYITYEIKMSDTLWDIASQYKSQHHSTPQFLDEIVQLNNLKSDHIAYGNQLLIPVAKQ